MEEEYILLYFIEGRYAGFQRRHIKYFSNYIFLQSFINRHPKISKYYVYQRLNVVHPVGLQQSL